MALTDDELWMIEEYKALRAEILANEDYQKNLLIFGSGVLAAAFGFIYRDAALENHRCLLLLLTQLLAIGFWYAFERLSVSTEEIGTYIACYMEERTALNWETYQRVRISSIPSSDPLGESPKATKEDHKKAFRRRFLDACSQLPFLIFVAVSAALIAVETLSAPTSKNTVIASLSGALFIAMAIAFFVHEWRLKSTRKLLDIARCRLAASIKYRKAKKAALTVPANASTGAGTTNKAVNPSGG